MQSPSLPILLQKNDLPPPFDLAKKRIQMDAHLKEKLTNLFWNLSGIPYSLRQSANGYIATLR